MQLTKLQIKNYRSIKDSGEIENITQMFALIGRNNTGKSAVLKSIQCLLLEKKFEKSDFHKSINENIRISGTILAVDDSGETTTEIMVEYDAASLDTKYFVNGEGKTAAAYKRIIPKLVIVDDIRNPDNSASGSSSTTSLGRLLDLIEELGTAERRRLESELIQVRKQETEEISREVTEKFKAIIQDSNIEIKIEPEADIDKAFKHRTLIRNTALRGCIDVDIRNSGTGLQSMYLLALLELLAEKKETLGESILLVEEPEVYLHPDFQRKMFSALHRIAGQNQVIFTTHSPIMVAEIWLTKSVRQVVLNENAETVISAVKVEDVINELGIRYEDVLNPALVVFVEGKNDKIFYEKIGILNPRVKIIPTDGFEAIHYFAFIKIICSEHVRNNFAIIADSDGTEFEVRKARIRSEIESQFQVPPTDLAERTANNIFVLERYAIESFFLSEDIISRALPLIPRADILLMLGEYQTFYDQKRQEMLQEGFQPQNFKKYFKPKLIFEECDHSAAETAYKHFWMDKQNFLRVRDLVIAECKNISQAQESWIIKFIEQLRVDDHQELLQLRANVLALLE